MKRDLDKLTEDGVVLLGVYTDPTNDPHALPRGVKQLARRHAEGGEQKTILNISSDNVDVSQTEEAWAFAHDANHIHVQEKEGDCSDCVHLTLSSLRNSRSIMDFDYDVFAGICCTMLSSSSANTKAVTPSVKLKEEVADVPKPSTSSKSSKASKSINNPQASANEEALLHILAHTPTPGVETEWKPRITTADRLDNVILSIEACFTTRHCSCERSDGQ